MDTKNILLIALVVQLIIVSCRKPDPPDSPPSPPSPPCTGWQSGGLIKNSSFECNDGRLSFKEWAVDNKVVLSSNDVPNGGGSNAMKLIVGKNKSNDAATYIIGQTGTTIYLFSVWIKNETKNGNGRVVMGIGNNRTTAKQQKKLISDDVIPLLFIFSSNILFYRNLFWNKLLD